MKLNLGCGNDVREGYVNVDFVPAPGVLVVDLSEFPWPWPTESVDEILMLDFLEHFPWRQTDRVLEEVYRVLKIGGSVDIQCPDVLECAKALHMEAPFLCNRCGWEFPKMDARADFFICQRCKQGWTDIALAAAHRIYGGQDREGNWHFNALSPSLLRSLLGPMGFGEFEELEFNQNGETLRQNWNFKLRAHKTGDVWGSDA